MSDTVEFADLSRLTGVLKNSKQMMDNTRMPVQNKQVQEHIRKTNTRMTEDIDYDSDYDEKEIPDLTGDYYRKKTISENRGSSKKSNNLFDFDEESMVNSKLPKAVLEVMRESQKERNVAMPNELSENLIKEVNSEYGNTKGQKATQQIDSGNIDYSLIKTIVEDCMKKYTSALKKTILNESKGGSPIELIAQEGNTFKFVTTDGKVFEGQMKFKGKIK